MTAATSAGAVVVTGGSGFVGSATAAALVAAGWEVHTVTRTAPAAALPGVRWHLLDLHDALATKQLLDALRPSHLLHLAWCATPGAFWTDLDNLRWVETSARLARQFADAGGQRLVGVGSCAEYDWTAGGRCSEQDTPLRPATLYGAAKLSVATALGAWAGEAGLSFGWARLFHLYGPGEPPGKLVHDVVDALTHGRPIELSGGEQARDFLHVADAAAALHHVLTSTLEGAVNVGSGQATTVRRVAELLATEAGRPDLLVFGGRLAAAQAPLVVADVERLSSSGWWPQRSLEAGLASLLARAPAP
jgi:nucleoside-diphosphate-sugar epimerase